MMSQEEFDRHLAEYIAQNGSFSRNPTPSYAQFQQFMTHNEAQFAVSYNPETQCSTSISRMSVEELLMAPRRHLLCQLDPELKGRSIWFKHDPTDRITNSVLKIIKSQLKKPYPTYCSLPNNEKEAWFRAFAQEFHWDHTYTTQVREAFEIPMKTSFEMVKDKQVIQSPPQDQQLSEGSVVESNLISESKINELVVEMIPNVKRRRIGFGTLSRAGSSSTTSPPNDKYSEELRLLNEEIAQMKKTIEHLSGVINRILAKFPELVPT